MWSRWDATNIRSFFLEGSGGGESMCQHAVNTWTKHRANHFPSVVLLIAGVSPAFVISVSQESSQRPQGSDSQLGSGELV